MEYSSPKERAVGPGFLSRAGQSLHYTRLLRSGVPLFWKIRDGLIWVECSFDSRVDEWRPVIEAVLKDPAYKAGMGLIYDVRRRARVPVTTEIQQTVSYLASRAHEIGRSRWAVVVSSTAGFGMGRMAGALLESSADTRPQGSMVTGGVFRDLAEAELWVRGSG